MKCNKGGQENITGSKFCCGCGSKLEKLCPKCQQQALYAQARREVLDSVQEL